MGTPDEHLPRPSSEQMRPTTGPWGARLRRPALAAAAVAVVLAVGSAAAAGGWVPIFEAEVVTPVPVGAAELVTLPDLEAYGDVVVTDAAEVRAEPDAAAAAAATGLDVPRPTALPRGVTGEPAYHVVGRVSATFRFSADRTAQAAVAAGSVAPSPPPGLDGSEVRFQAGPAVAAIWTSASGGPSLAVGRAVAPSASSSGVPFDALRDYVLSIPGVSDDVAAALRAITSDGSTLPLPLPTDLLDTSTARLGGETATVLTTRDRTFSAVVWVDDGIVSVVAGPLDADEVLAVAAGLR